MSIDFRNDFLGQVVAKFIPFVAPLYSRHRTIINYLFSGGSAAFINLASLYVLTDFVGLWYLLSAVLAFLLAFGASFYFQKHWTFEDHSSEGVHVQMAFYLLVALVNLVINTALMYVFVEFAGFWYLSAQILTSAIIAVESFFAYRLLIFKKRPTNVGL